MLKALFVADPKPYTCERVIVPSGVNIETAIANLANSRFSQGAELVTSTTINGEVYLIFKDLSRSA